jgi:hypothetical protein
LEGIASALKDQHCHVAFNSALALARIGPNAASYFKHLQEAVYHYNRYVQGMFGQAILLFSLGFALLALHRLKTPEADSFLLQFYRVGYWDPVTTPGESMW